MLRSLVTLSTSGSSYFHVLLTTVRHLLNAARIVCGRVYVTLRCPFVCLSVCLSHLSTVAAVCGWFAAVGPADINIIDCCMVEATVSSVTLSADVGSLKHRLILFRLW